jgi:DNA-binding Lrp family transcriptional regulator
MADSKTIELLEMLERDPRLTPAQLATMAGIAEDEARERIAQAEREGLIVGYRTIVNWERAGVEQVAALIEVKVSPQRDVGFDAVAARIYRFPEARSVYLMSGAYDLAVLVVGATMKDVANFVSSKLAPLEGVQGTVTHFLLKRYKEDGVVLVEEPSPGARLPIAP